jgi:hypothetical protein
MLQCELEAAVKADDVFLGETPAYQWTLVHLAKMKSLSEAVSLAKTLRDDNLTFEKRAKEHFRKSIEGLPKGKSEALRCIRRIATIGLQSGRENSEFLKVITTDVLTKTPKQVADIILRSIRARSSRFDCLFALKGEATAVQRIARKVGFRLVSYRDLPSGRDISEFVVASKDAVCVGIEEDGF